MHDSICILLYKIDVELRSVLIINYHEEETVARNMMSTVQEVAFCFNYSAKRLLRYQEALTNDVENRAAMTRRSKLKVTLRNQMDSKS